MATRKVIDWNSLKLPDYESVDETHRRLQAITRELLTAKGLTPEPEKNSPGFNPTVAQAREVAVMSCLGLQPQDIALVLNIELKILNVFYKKELGVSANMANSMVARKALSMAMSGKQPDMTKFWLKARAGWKETNVTELTGKDGGPVDITSAKNRLRDAVAASAKAVKPQAKK